MLLRYSIIIQMKMYIVILIGTARDFRKRSYKVIQFWNEGYDKGWIIRFAIAKKKRMKLLVPFS